MINKVLMVVIFLAAGVFSFSDTVYCWSGAIGSANGIDWTNAYTVPNSAYAAADSGQLVWVAGSFDLTTAISLNVRPYVTIYGTEDTLRAATQSYCTLRGNGVAACITNISAIGLVMDGFYIKKGSSYNISITTGRLTLKNIILDSSGIGIYGNGAHVLTVDAFEIKNMTSVAVYRCGPDLEMTNGDIYNCAGGIKLDIRESAQIKNVRISKISPQPAVSSAAAAAIGVTTEHIVIDSCDTAFSVTTTAVMRISDTRISNTPVVFNGDRYIFNRVLARNYTDLYTSEGVTANKIIMLDSIGDSTLYLNYGANDDFEPGTYNLKSTAFGRNIRVK